MAVARIVLSVTYCLLGFIAFLTFLSLGNYPSALWSLATALISLQIFHLHFLEHRQQLELSYNDRDIRQLIIVGIICTVLGAIGFLMHISFEIVYKKGITPIGESEIIRMVWSFMTTKVSLALTFIAKRYRRDISGDRIISENVEASS